LVHSRPDLLRKINDRQVLNLIRQKSPISRTEIARELKIALPTVSRIVDSFLERGWLQSVGAGDSTGGRPPTLVELKADSRGAIGVEIGRGSVRIVYTDLLADVLLNDERPIEEVEGPNGLVRYIQGFIEYHRLKHESIVGIGIAAPGPLDPSEGLLFTQNLRGEWLDKPITKIVSNHLGLPCCVSNDADAAALAESWFGKGESFDSVLFILADTGIGAGLVIQGSIWSGEHHLAGDFAHMIVNLDEDNETCFCGRRGCVNAYASLPAIEQAVVRRGKLDKHLPWYEVIERARHGHSPELEVMNTAARYLATAIVNMVDVVDPGIVILGGRNTLHADNFFFDLVQGSIEGLVPNAKAEIAVTGFGVDAVSVGAASLVLQSIYDHMYVVDSQ
jgi:N-acetylglucosamine repressor